MGRDVRLAMRAAIITAPLASGFGLTAYGNSGSQLTLCWREMDSNHRYPEDKPPLRDGLLSPS